MCRTEVVVAFLFVHLKGLVSTWAFSQKEQTVTAEVKGVLFWKAWNTVENNSRYDTTFWECVKVMSEGRYHYKKGYNSDFLVSLSNGLFCLKLWTHLPLNFHGQDPVISIGIHLIRNFLWGLKISQRTNWNLLGCYWQQTINPFLLVKFHWNFANMTNLWKQTRNKIV